jgi:hypothetical protein
MQRERESLLRDAKDDHHFNKGRGKQLIINFF